MGDEFYLSFGWGPKERFGSALGVAATERAPATMTDDEKCPLLLSQLAFLSLPIRTGGLSMMNSDLNVFIFD